MSPKCYLMTNRPVCVILHPKLIEGVSFPMAPTMHVLEVPDGFGKTDQIYARILRYIHNDDMAKNMPTII